ncbi:NADP-dependent oxidoreductase [Luteococcus sp. Sow4_B9]|uniref:NADP-dependent oxidoreductase n=1 Tax=Luteococcus sp. Sow4_B9 TaxID=3438792 RepID=UPI003F9B6035
MRAFGITRYGQTRLEELSVAEPELGPHDVLVDVRASSVNPVDLLIARGDFKRVFPAMTPLVLGHDVAGVVLATGARVGQWKVGDEVMARPGGHSTGTFAERALVREEDIAAKPGNVGFAAAASLPLVAETAWQAFTEVTSVGPGTKVLVHGAAGGLGSVAAQLAVHLGAEVTATCSGRDVDLVRDYGVARVIDYRTEDFSTLVSGQDVVLETVGGENQLKSLAVTAPGGTVVSVVGPPAAEFARQAGKPWLAPVMSLMSRKVRAEAKRHGANYRFLFLRPDGAQLAHLGQLVEQGALVPRVGHTFDFDQTPEAVALVADKKARGKVVIKRTPGA